MLHRCGLNKFICLPYISIWNMATSNDIPTLRYIRLTPNALPPTRGSRLSAGLDLRSAYNRTIPAFGKAIVEPDLAILLPPGCYGRFTPRSGLAVRHHINSLMYQLQTLHQTYRLLSLSESFYVITYIVITAPDVSMSFLNSSALPTCALSNGCTLSFLSTSLVLFNVKNDNLPRSHHASR
jgi:hypothetical protein